MPLDPTKYHDSASNGDVSYNVFVITNAIEALSRAIKSIGERSQVDVDEELANVGAALDLMREDAERLIGWQPDER